MTMGRYLYAPLRPDEINTVQQMIQGTELCSIDLRLGEHFIFAAHNRSGRIIALMCGENETVKDNPPEFAPHLTVTCSRFFYGEGDAVAETEMRIAFALWAHDRFGSDHPLLHQNTEISPPEESPPTPSSDDVRPAPALFFR